MSLDFDPGATSRDRPRLVVTNRDEPEVPSEDVVDVGVGAHLRRTVRGVFGSRRIVGTGHGITFTRATYPPEPPREE
ncbi:hypothetical protein [Halomarina ordinaria]|uniref:Uncharacterized protein n=1 Tax=Halomarina ordinaria TaxID=3033939 RepID=A0ABD5UJ74_9EURY|nr:hypothetical protein [Halomarina sp. PSRA2]